MVNNAGNNRRNTFADTTLEDLRNVIDVHLVGSFLVTQAAWPIFAAKRYGRIVFTTSQVGFYGKVDSVAYGAAKAGVVGLMHGVRLSADPLGIKVNCISPFALTRLGDIFPKDIADYIDPAQVASAIVILCSEACPVSGEIVIAGGGHFATARTLESRGIDIDNPAEVSAEAIVARLVRDFRHAGPAAFPRRTQGRRLDLRPRQVVRSEEKLAAEIGGADFGVFRPGPRSAVQADFAVLKHVAILACRKRARAFCSTRRIGTPSRLMRARIANTCSISTGERPRLGSSMSRSFGRAMSARPIISICCSPPESVPACCLARSFRRGK